MIKADKILISTSIFDAVTEKSFAGGIAIKGNNIVYVGENIERFIDTETELFDYGDCTIMPGIVDAHDHFFDGAVSASEHMCCDLQESRSEHEAVQIMLEYAQKHPDEKRLRGIGWFIANWNDDNLPSKKSLDKAFPDIPVYLISADIHTFWMNTAALIEAGYIENHSVYGDKLGRLDSGELSGLAFEAEGFAPAMEKVMDFERNTLKEVILSFVRGLNRCGITSVSDLSAFKYIENNIKKLDVAKKMSEEGSLNCRLHVYLDINEKEDYADIKSCSVKYNNDYLRVEGLKGFVDGVTSTYSSLLIEPYEDNPKTRGIGVPVDEKSILEKKVAKANAEGFPVRLHCTGDGAVKMALDAFEESIAENGKHGLKNAIEHIEIVDPKDIPRFKELDVIPSMQPMHLLLDNNEKLRRCGKNRCRWEWAHKSLLSAGAKLAFGTDYPVVDYNPFLGICAAVTRKTDDGQLAGTNEEEAISLSEALIAYTINAANSYDREKEIGSIEEGKLADIVVLDRDIFNEHIENLKDIKVRATIVGGRFVYEEENI